MNPRLAVAYAVILAVSAHASASAAPIPSPDFSRLPMLTTRTSAQRSGEVLSTSRTWIEPVERNGESLIAVVSHTAQPLGTTVEERTLVRAGATVRCIEQEHRVRDAGGEVVAVSMKQFRAEAVPFSSARLPDDTYPPGALLIYLLALLPLDGTGHGSFHVLGEATVWRMDAWRGTADGIVVPAGRFACHRLRMRPDPDSLGFPGFLRPFVRYFIPEFEAWIADDPPHLAVRIAGPFGPPRERDIVVELASINDEPRP